jgi:LysM repeat protein
VRSLKRRLLHLSGNGLVSWPALTLAAAAAVVALVPLGSSGAALADVTVQARPVQAAAPAAPPAAVSEAAPVITARAVVRPSQVTVQRGDTLSKISARVCGTVSDWSGLYAANKAGLRGGPDSVRAGQVLKVHCYDPGYTYPKPKIVPHVQARVQAKVQTPAPAAATAALPASVPSTRTGSSYSGGAFTTAGIEALWESAGGPAWAASHAAEIAYCESGYNPRAYNPSGATGLWQILGSVIAGDLTNPMVNAENAVAKFRSSGNTFAQWVCT